MRVSNYRASHGEANFGKPIRTQVQKGAHITFECVTRTGGRYYMARWPRGLPGHEDPPNTLRFPHGLIRFGETLEQCVRRLVRAQLGMGVRSVRIVEFDSYVDSTKHWHIEPCCLVEVTGRPNLPQGASDIISFGLRSIPQMTYWTRKDFLELVRCFP